MHEVSPTGLGISIYKNIPQKRNKHILVTVRVGACSFAKIYSAFACFTDPLVPGMPNGLINKFVCV